MDGTCSIIARFSRWCGRLLLGNPQHTLGRLRPLHVCRRDEDVVILWEPKTAAAVWAALPLAALDWQVAQTLRF
jgi:hypothetical protein